MKFLPKVFFYFPKKNQINNGKGQELNSLGFD